MTTINFRQLIDLAIGTPEPGHVNFYALHCLLYSFAEELNITDKSVDCSKYGNISMIQIDKSPSEMEVGKAMERGSAAAMAQTQRSEGGAAGESSSSREGSPPPPAAAAAAEAPPTTTPSSPDEPTKAGTPGSDEFCQLAAKLQDSLNELEARLVLLEANAGTNTAATATSASASTKPLEDLNKGIAVMKEQLDLTMQQLLTLTALTVDAKAGGVAESGQRLGQLRTQTNRLRSVQHENVYIEASRKARDDEERSTSWRGSEDDVGGEIEAGEDEAGEEEQLDLASPTTLSQTSQSLRSRGPEEPQYELENHLCYTPEKMLDQLLELKSEFCQLTNKVNDISATILEQDCMRTTQTLLELQEQLNEMKYFTSTLKDMQVSLDTRQTASHRAIEEIQGSLVELGEEKIDKDEIEVLLADKVDYAQLQRKVSVEHVQDMKCQLEREFCELRKLIDLNEKRFGQLIEELRVSLGHEAMEQLLSKFREKIEHDLRSLQETLQKYLQSTDDECAAAGARIKVLQDLACLSCDTTCVMRTMEKAKVGKLPDAHATSFLGPLITYELGSIRKSGLMGYYRKDEFPHAPSAWLDRQNVAVSMKSCVPRHAGGAHTTSTAKERVEKVLLNKK